MLSQLTIPKKKTITAIDEATAPLDHEQLFVIGLGHVQKLASRIWNDYNVHDPGITTLELLAYSLTDLSYRASFPIKDLLASSANNAAEMKEQFFTAREILPNKALTLGDYRKLLIDLQGVKNAWIQPVTTTYYADAVAGALYVSPPAGAPVIVPVNVRGLYEVLVQYTDAVLQAGTQAAVNAKVKETLNANRNLCEDFVAVKGITTQEFVLCAELELSPDANVLEVHAQILFQVDEYLAPAVHQYTLSEMLEKTTADGEPYTADRIFEGPVLSHGFIADDELENSDLRTEIRLSDIINIIMDIDGVLAVRDIMFNPAGTTTPLANKWVIPVIPGRQCTLDRDDWRLVSYKRSMPFTPLKADVNTRWDALETTDAVTPNTDDFDIPLGTYRNLASYYSVQNHFPAVYGIGETGVRSGADAKTQALAKQLKGYLLFFDQIMANYFAQLSHIRDLFSADPAMERTYFYQLVDSFGDYASIYGVAPGSVVSTIESQVEDQSVLVERRNRFLDHMIARFAEQFTDFANVMYDEFGASSVEMIAYKGAFLADYPSVSGGRSLAYNHAVQTAGTLWNSSNISGLERRLAGLLGITDSTRRDLGDPGDGEGMYVIENILLRPDLPANPSDPFLPICADPNCVDCSSLDPYTYRLHIILPAYGPRFGDIDFRRWAEQVIRAEVPAHIQPKICWINETEMQALQWTYYLWINLISGADTTQRTVKLQNFIADLYRVRNVYPAESLHECTDPESEPRFILGRSALGTM